MSYVQERLAELKAKGEIVHHKPKPNQNRSRVKHLTRDDFRLIRELARYLPQREIARKFETSQQHVHRIINYRVAEPLR